MPRKTYLPEEIEKKYMNEYSLRVRFENDIKDIVSEIITTSGYEIALLTSRTKEVNKFVAKATRLTKTGKTYKYTSPFTQITDITGIRVIVQYKDKAESIEKVLRQHFIIDEVRSRNTIKEAKDYEFGYSAIHLVCSLTDVLCEKYRCQFIKNWKIEIQIRTILEHAWAELSRPLFYNKSIRNEYVRELNFLAADVERNDKEFIRLRDKVENKFLATEVERHSPLTRLTIEETVELLKKSPTILQITTDLAHMGLTVDDRIRENYATGIADILAKHQVKFGGDAESAIRQNKDKIVLACRLYMNATNMTSFSKDTLLIAGLAIVENGGIPPEEYSRTWSDTWRNGFRAAAKSYETQNA